MFYVFAELLFRGEVFHEIAMAKIADGLKT